VPIFICSQEISTRKLSSTDEANTQYSNHNETQPLPYAYVIIIIIIIIIMVIKFNKNIKQQLSKAFSKCHCTDTLLDNTHENPE